MNELDPRVKRTKKMFKNALKELMLSNKDYMDITVKELCEKAELNRRTFYLHYEYIDDVLADIQKDFSQEFYEATKQYDHIKDIEPVVKVFFDIHDSNPIYEKIILSPAEDYLREIMRSKTVAVLDENDKLQGIRHLDILTQNIIEQFYHMTVVSAYREWARQRKIISKDEIVKLTTKLVRSGLSFL